MVTALWKFDLESIPRPTGENNLIKGGPLFDLPGLQAMICSGQLNLGDDDQFWVGTENCWNSLGLLKWTAETHVRNLILLLKPEKYPKGDFINAQWCKDSEDGLNRCDSYKIRVDEVNWNRDANAPMFYIKFSLDNANVLYLVLISCHLDKPY